MTFTLLHKRSAVPGHSPTTSQLSLGEIAMNTNDGLVYFMQSVGGSNSIVVLGPVPPTANALTNAVTLALSGDATGSVSFNGANNVTIATTLVNSGVTAGTYGSGSLIPVVTVNSKGLVTSISNTAISVTGLLGYTPLNAANASVTISGDATGTSSFAGTNAVNVAITLGNVGTAGTYSAPIVNAKGLVTGSTALTFTGDATGSGTGASIALTLANSGVTAGTFTSYVVNAKGLVTSGINASFTGDATGTASGSTTNLTLATVNSNVGAFGTTTVVPTLTVNAKGLVTAISNSAIAFPVTSVFGRTGNVVLQSSDVTTALGYTPQGTIVASGDASGTSTQNAITLTLATVNAAPGTYGTASIIPTITVNAKGLVTSISNTAITGVGLLGYTPLNAANASVTLTGDATGTASYAGSNAVSVAVTLPTVGTAGTFSSVTVNAKGLVTAGGNIAASGDATGTVSGTSLPLTLATVNGAVGTFGGSITVPVITVNAKGLVTNVTISSVNVVSALGYTPVNNAVVGVANGIATLNSAGQLTMSQIPASITGAVVYQGVWDAFTNTPTLTSSVGTKGWYYKVSNAGTTTLNGLSTWNLGDTAIFDGSTWDKIDGVSAEVLSFNTRVGAITLTSSDVTTALGYTPQGTIVASGDASGTSTQNAITLTLATVNAAPGTYGTASIIPTITVNAKGLVTSISNTAITGVGLLGYTPLNAANASVTLTGDATGTASFAGSNAVSVAVTLPNVGTAGTFSSVTVNAKGLVTAGGNIAASGDATGTVSGTSLPLTLATVNTNIGTFGTTTVVPTLTVNAKGLVTSISNSAIAFPVTTVFGRTGNVVLQSSDVTTALGYTPQGTIVASGDASGTSTQNAITLTLATVNANIGTFGIVTVNAKGLVTSAQNGTYSGDVSGTSNGASTTLTLATVNASPGTYGTASIIPTITVNAKGLVTSISNTAITGVGLLGYTPLNAANASVTLTGGVVGTASFAGSNAVSISASLATSYTAGTYAAPIVNNQGLVTGSTALTFTGDATGSGSGASIALTLANSGVTAGTYTSLVVNSKGVVTSGLNQTFTGDVTGTGNGVTTVMTLATVNSNVGTFVGQVVVNAKGLVTAAANVTTFAGYNLGIGYGTPGTGDTIDGGSF